MSHTDDEIRTIIQNMSLEKKIGQLFLLAYPSKNPEKIRPLMKKYGISGCYISQDNGNTFEDAEKTTSKLQEMAKEYNIPPLMLGVDQEGSWGVLVPDSSTGPGNLALGTLPSTSDTTEMYKIIGREMLSVGYNTLLAPCADINSDLNSPIIGTRSFGESPERVSIHVEAAVKSAAKTGILTTLKHFPGHGATDGDTHREIPQVNKSMEELLKTDLLPFKRGVDAGADIVMTSHILYPQIDPKNPATLSSVILKNVLRKIIGFKGIILSDSMNMGAIRKFYNSTESALMALKAGVDLIMLSEEHYDHSPEYLNKQIATLEYVKNALKENKITAEEIDEKLFHILSVKFRRMKTRTPRLSEMEKKSNENTTMTISQHCIHLLQTDSWMLPQSGTIVCVNTSPRSAYSKLMNSRGIGPNQEDPAFDLFQKELETLKSGFLFMDYEETKRNLTNTKILEKASAIIAVTEDYPLPGEDFPKEEQITLVQDIAERYKKKTMVVGLRSAYELQNYPKNIPYLCAYSSRSSSARMMARTLMEKRI